MDMGADGIRADMAGALVKGTDVNGDTKKFWKEIRQIVKEKYPQAFMVSEWSYPKDALDAFHFSDGFDQEGEVRRIVVVPGAAEFSSIGIDVLAEQSDFAHATNDQPGNFGQHVGLRARDFLAARVRYNAESAIF